jgi:putative FmdB family regulatory protein
LTIYLKELIYNNVIKCYNFIKKQEEKWKFMPIFDFFCNNCSKTFERFVSSFKEADGIQCPHCGSKEIKKILSGFNCGSTGRSIRKNGTMSSCGGSARGPGRSFG